MINKIKKWIKRTPFLAIPLVIIHKILPGFFLYRKITKQYGEQTKIFRTAWHGTGDYYICGMYLPAYLKQQGISDYVFLVKDTGSERKVTELFNVYQGHVVPIPSVDALSRFSEFMRQEEPLCRSFEKSDHLSFIGEQLKGYHGLSLMDFYLWYGFGFQNIPARADPQFSQDIERIRDEMEEKGLPRGKTILLSPYSTCSKEYLPPKEVWEEITKHLKRRGYAVVTNCFGKETPVKGTASVSIAYTDLVPFLNEAGGFIGIRSGLCDILSQSTCKKIIIYPEQSDFWPSGMSEHFTGLNKMGLTHNSMEVYYSQNIITLICDVLKKINTW